MAPAALDRGLTSVTVLAALLAGAAAGLGLYTLAYADGLAYLRDDPEACANCHVMQGHLDAWVKSSHGKFATCNDCHAPHEGGLANLYYCKARNGLFHSVAFTTGRFPDNLRITDYNRGVTENACRHCHSTMTHAIEPVAEGSGDPDALACIRCHPTVGHDR